MSSIPVLQQSYVRSPTYQLEILYTDALTITSLNQALSSINYTSDTGSSFWRHNVSTVHMGHLRFLQSRSTSSQYCLSRTSLCRSKISRPSGFPHSRSSPVVTPKSGQYIDEPKYIFDQNWVKFPSLVLEISCPQSFRDTQTHRLTHGRTHEKTEYLRGAVVFRWRRHSYSYSEFVRRRMQQQLCRMYSVLKCQRLVHILF